MQVIVCNTFAPSLTPIYTNIVNYCLQWTTGQVELLNGIDNLISSALKILFHIICYKRAEMCCNKGESFQNKAKVIWFSSVRRPFYLFVSTDLFL